MNSKEIIEALKANERPFGLMTEEMQAMAKEIDRKRFYRWAQAGSTGAWCVDNLNIVNFPDHSTTYRLRPDYALKPRLIECEVYKNPNGYLVFDNKTRYAGTTTSIKEAMCCFNFIGFKYEDDRMHCQSKRSPSARLYINIESGDTLEYVGSNAYNTYEVLTPTHVLFKEVK